MNWVSEIGFSGTWNQPKNGLKRQVEQDFFFIFAKFFDIFDYFSKFRSTFGELHFEKSSKICQKITKNKEK